MVFCYIGLGSNLGDREHNIHTAVRKMKSLMHTKVRRISSVIETLPQGGPAQGLYLNAVAEIETGLDPYRLLVELQSIEMVLGRVRTVLNGPRTIDLDILTYGDICIEEEALCIPHPRMLEREFVLIPLQEIAPGVIEKVKKIRKLKKVNAKKPAKKAVKKISTQAKRKKRIK
jgi:2-amino-4-hydroxy-6-hydroxymethyldihydropteridine diphosphokinase